jgi:hypothetical protein
LPLLARPLYCAGWNNLNASAAGAAGRERTVRQSILFSIALLAALAALAGCAAKEEPAKPSGSAKPAAPRAEVPVPSETPTAEVPPDKAGETPPAASSGGAARPGAEMRLVYEFPAPEAGAPEPDPQEARRVVLARIDPQGERGYTVRAAGPRRLELVLPLPPGDADAPALSSDVRRVRHLMCRQSQLEFRIVADKVKDLADADLRQILQEKDHGNQISSDTWSWRPLRNGWALYTNPADKGGNLLEAWNYVYDVDLESQTVDVLIGTADGQNVTGRDLAEASVTRQGDLPILAFTLKAEAAPRFAKLTGPEALNRHLAILLNGVIQSAPVLRSTLSTGGLIEGFKTQREAEEVAATLGHGPPSAYDGEPVEEVWVGPLVEAASTDGPAVPFKPAAAEYVLTLQSPAGKGPLLPEAVLARVRQTLGRETTLRPFRSAGAVPDDPACRFLVGVPRAGGDPPVMAGLRISLEDLRPKSAASRVDVVVAELTQNILQARLAKEPVVAPVAGVARVRVAAARYLPAEYRSYLNTICLTVRVDPPMTLEDARNRLEAFLIEKYADLGNVPHALYTGEAVEGSGECRSVEVWIREPFISQRNAVPGTTFWSDVVRQAFGRGEPWVRLWYGGLPGR